MVRVADEKERHDFAVAQERTQLYARELRDFMRSGDETILRRILFRYFVQNPTPKRLRAKKALAIMYIMASDQTINIDIHGN